MDGRGHRFARDLRVAVRDRDRAFLMQTQQHLRAFIAEVVHETVVKSAIAGARIERDIGDVGRAKCVSDHIAAETGSIDTSGYRTIERG